MKFNFRENNNSLISHFGIPVAIKKISSSISVGGVVSSTYGDEEIITCAISNVKPIEKQTMSFDVSKYTQILKLKVLEEDLPPRTRFLIHGLVYELIDKSFYSNISGRGMKIFVGLLDGIPWT